MKKFFIGLVFLIGAIKALESFYPFSHGDALYYHLVGPKIWLKTSLSEMTTSFFPFLQAGYFDYLYIIPNFLFGTTLTTQITSQFFHWFCSIGLMTLILFRYFKKNDQIIMGCLAILSIMTIAKGGDFFFYAKNDGPMTMMALLTSILVLEEKKSPAWLIGLCLGLLPAIKLNALILTAILAIYFVYKNIKAPLRVFTAALVAVIILSPLLARNFLLIGNPLFPGLVKQLPGKLSPAMVEVFTSAMGSALSMESLGPQLKTFFMGKALFLLTPILFVLNIRSKAGGVNIYYMISLTYFSFYLLLNGGVVSERFLFPAFALNIFFIFKSLSNYKVPNWAIAILVLFIIVDSKIDKSIKRVGEIAKIYSSRTMEDIRRQYIPISTLWDHVDEKSLVISDQSSQQFYAKKGVRLEQFSANFNAEFLRDCKAYDVHLLNRYKYAILAKENSNPCYHKIKNSQLVAKSGVYTLYRLK